MDIQPSSEEVRQSLERIAASPGFAGAGRLAPFLRHVVETALRGETDRLKESVLGVEAFGRTTDFDPRTDPVVRVEARRLRARLEEYYAGPGADDSIRIDLPKGGYVPMFSRREAASRALSRRGLLVVSGVAAAAALSGAGAWWLWTRRKPLAAPQIAVLPFLNLSDDKANEYLSDGLTEELIDRLAKAPGVKVASRGMVFQFKGSRTDIREIASRLGATAVVEGSVRKQDKRVRISARLVDAQDGSPIWSNTYEREMEDLFALQDELAAAIAGALRVELSRPPGDAVRPPISLEAYNLHLQARYQMNLYSEDGFKRAIGYLEDCLKLEPRYAPAYADLSVIYSFIGYYGAMPDDVCWPRASEYAGRALAIDPRLAEAWSAKGLEAGFHRWSWDEARLACEKAIELDPGSAFAHAQLGTSYLLPKGMASEAIAEFEKAVSLSPLLSVAQYILGFAYLSAGRYEDAVRQYRKTIELGSINPDLFWDYGMALGFLGRIEEARKAFERKRLLLGQNPAQLSGLEAWFAGDREKARRDAAAVERWAREGRDEMMDAARYFAMTGEKEKALEWIEKAVEKRERQAIWILADPRLESIRNEPRLRAAARRMGLIG